MPTRSSKDVTPSKAFAEKTLRASRRLQKKQIPPTHPDAVLFQKEIFPYLFLLEQCVGDVLNWRAIALGFYLGKGKTIPQAVALATSLFPTPGLHEPNLLLLAKSSKFTGIIPYKGKAYTLKDGVVTHETEEGSDNRSGQQHPGF